MTFREYLTVHCTHRDGTFDVDGLITLLDASEAMGIMQAYYLDDLECRAEDEGDFRYRSRIEEEYLGPFRAAEGEWRDV